MRRSLLVCPLFFDAPLAAQSSAVPGPRFFVTFPTTKSAAPLDGRLLLLLSTDSTAEPRMQISDIYETQLIFGRDVEVWAGGRIASVDGRVEGYPVSPDGRRVAVARWADINFNAEDVWVLDLTQRTRTRLTFDTAAAWPVWTPDGRRIAYRQRSGIYWVAADGSGTPESLVTAAGQWWPAAFEPGGRALAYHGIASRGSKGEIWRRGLGGSETPHQVLAGAFHNYDPSLSPDGRWMAYVSDESGRFEVYVRPYPVPAAGGRCRWTAARSRCGHPPAARSSIGTAIA